MDIAPEDRMCPPTAPMRVSLSLSVSVGLSVSVSCRSALLLLLLLRLLRWLRVPRTDGFED